MRDAELQRLEDELAELEATHDFDAGESPEIEALIGRIAELSAELDAAEDQALEAMPPERRVVHTICETRPAPTQAELEAADARARKYESKRRRREAADARERALESKRRRREARLRSEWERWRYQRAKLPAGERGPMLKIGERVCRYCGGVFVVDDLRRRFCPDRNCRQLHHKAARAGSLT